MRRALALVLLVALAACGRADWRIGKLYGGRGSVELLTAPDRIEAFRIAPDPARDARATDPVLGRFPILGDAVAVPAEDAAALSAILLDPDTYDWDRAKGCDFRPGVGLRFHRRVSHLDVALCFECDELMIFRQGQVAGMEDFDAARPRLVAIVRRLFPDDPAILALE